MQRRETLKSTVSTELSECPESGRLIGIDPGTLFIGIAVTDPTQTVTRPVKTIHRASWKSLLTAIKEILTEFDAVAVVIGLPLAFESETGEMAGEADDIARKLSLSLEIPVFQQDERLTTFDARKRIWDRKIAPEDTKKFVDAEAAAIILSDFLSRLETFRSRT